MAITTNAHSSLPDAHGYLDRVIGELRALQVAAEGHAGRRAAISVGSHPGHAHRNRRDLRQRQRQPAVRRTADELEEIVTETARAANRIMDAAETIEDGGRHARSAPRTPP